MKVFVIGGENFILEKLKLGQMRQLLEALGDVEIDLDADPMAIALSLVDRLPAVMAVVLCPEGVELQDKDLEAITQTMADMELDMAVEVVADFLELNRASWIENRIRSIARMFKEAQPTTLTSGSAGSARGTPAS